MLAEIAECHKRRQKNGQRQSHGYHGESGIEKQFGQHIYSQTFAHEIIDIPPQKLHQHYEQAYKKRHGKQRQESLQHKRVKSLYS